MLRIDKGSQKLVRLTKSDLAGASHWERHLQSMICAAPNAFWDEIGEDLSVIGQEVRPSDAVPDRIDILTIDEEGNAVVIELKRGTHKLQLLQAISYAGMVSRWSPEQFVETLATHSSLSRADARSAIEDHTGGDISAINNIQRVLLIAEDFDPAVLIASEWLHENYGVDIRCYRLQLSQESGSDYLTCTCIYPPVEIASLTRRSDRSISSAQSSGWESWADALSSVENEAVRDFFEAELGSNQENRLRYQQLVYRIDNKRRYWVTSRTRYAHVRQVGRFSGDEEFWREALSAPDSVRKGKNDGEQSLSFRLITPADFAAFKKAITGNLRNVAFSSMSEETQLEIDT